MLSTGCYPQMFHTPAAVVEKIFLDRVQTLDFRRIVPVGRRDTRGVALPSGVIRTNFGPVVGRPQRRPMRPPYSGLVPGFLSTA